MVFSPLDCIAIAIFSILVPLPERIRPRHDRLWQRYSSDISVGLKRSHFHTVLSLSLGFDCGFS